MLIDQIQLITDYGTDNISEMPVAYASDLFLENELNDYLKECILFL